MMIRFVAANYRNINFSSSNKFYLLYRNQTLTVSSLNLHTSSDPYIVSNRVGKWNKNKHKQISMKKKRNFSLPISVLQHHFKLLFNGNPLLMKQNNNIGQSNIIKQVMLNLQNEEDKGIKMNRKNKDNDSDNDLINDLMGANVSNVAEVADVESKCCQRLLEWDKYKILEVAGLFYRKNYNAKLYYSQMITVLNAQWSELNFSKDECLQLLFFIILVGDSPELLLMNIENTLEQSEQYTSDQVSLICIAFFLANRRLKSQTLLNSISKSVIDNIDGFQYSALNNVLKAFRHANHFSEQFCNQIGEFLLKKYSCESTTKFFIIVMEACRYYSSVRYYHPRFVQSLEKKLRENSSSNLGMRSKDYSQLLMCLASFGQKLDENTLEICNKQLETFRQEGQYSTYPEALVTSLTAMAMMQYYPVNLLKYVFSGENLKKLNALPHVDKNFQILLLYISTLIEKPEAELSLPKWYMTSFPTAVLGVVSHELNTRLGLERLITSLKEHYGAECLMCHCILPCFQTASVEMHFSTGQTAVLVNYDSSQHTLEERISHLRQRLSGQDFIHSRELIARKVYQLLMGDDSTEKLEEKISINSLPIRRLSIELVGYHQCSINADQILGLTRMKHRLLRHLGYDVITISAAEGKRFFELPTASILTEIIPRITNLLITEEISGKMDSY